MRIQEGAHPSGKYAMLLVLGIVGWLGLQMYAADSAYQQDFTENIQTLTIRNSLGSVEVQTWNEQFVRVIARPFTRMSPGSIGDLVLWQEQQDKKLEIWAKMQASVSDEVDLVVFVPMHLKVFVRTTDGRVTIKGVSAAMAVESGTGAITCAVPVRDADAHVSLHTVEGELAVEIPLNIFGEGDLHSLDGWIGNGGCPLIMHSRTGNIRLTADDPNRAMTMGETRASGGEGPQTVPSGSSLPPVQRTETVRRSPAEQTGSANSKTASPRPATMDTGPAGGFRIRVNSQLVSLNVRVVDEYGNVLSGLTKDNFTVLDNGQDQPIIHFEPQSAPLNLLLLLDLSGSTKSKTKIIKRSAIRFIESLSEDDNIAVAAFTSRFMMICSFTNDRKLLRNRIDGIKNRGGGTAFYEAMWYSLDELKDLGSTRKTIVVMSDGVDNVLQDPNAYSTDYEYDELLARIDAGDVTVFPVYLDTEYEQVVEKRNISSLAYRTSRKQIGLMAERSGGTMFTADRVEDLERVYSAVAGELRTLYSLGYNAPEKARQGREWREVTIQVDHPGARVKTRPGYYLK